MSARHVDSTSPERVKTMMAVGRMKDGETTLRVVCSWCHLVIRSGDGPTSHGLCEPCAELLALPTPLKRLARAIAMYGDAVAHKEGEGAAYARALAWVDREVGVR